MEAFKITGKTPLHGSVRIGGAKNASYKLMIASLLANSESRLLNFSHISDVETVAGIIAQSGCQVKKAGERALFIDPTGFSSTDLRHINGKQGRFSTLFIAPLLARHGQAIVPIPGGDKIGKRPLERHFQGLEALGAHIEEKDGLITARTDGLKGTTYHFSKNTHTGTETVLLAAVLAEGTTVLENAAEEPEVDDLILYLNAMGARISREANKVIRIEGVPELHGAIHKIMPDRNEAVSYACAALVTKGDVIIENARAEHITAFLTALDSIKAGYEIGTYGIRFFWKEPLMATDIATAIEPGFMTDWQPLLATVLTQCQGISTLHETVMQDRFQYVDQLKNMGADIERFQPEVIDKEMTYNFNLTDDSPEATHAIRVHGPSNLQAGTFKVYDLRHGATLMIAAMAAHGESILMGIEHIERGYEALPERLNSIGAQIERVNLAT
ncbi:MAG: UDP-N-acetylglucosamine 1-carboxyvinyltransferase [Patescibacteria group bacterium]